MMKQMFFPLAFALTGCYKISYINGPVDGPYDKEITHKTYVSGVVEPDELDISQICPNGFQKIEHKVTVKNQLYTIGTQLLLTPVGLGALPVQWFEPHTVRVDCASGSPMPSEESPVQQLEQELEATKQKIEEDINEGEQSLEKSADEMNEKIQKELEE